MRKNKRMLGIYIDHELYKLITQRAGYRNITLTRWVLLAIADLLVKEDHYLS